MGSLDDGRNDVDIGLEGDDQWWFNLRTQQVERGSGAPNAERMGPYATEREAAEALERARERSEAWEAEDND
jgi:hypothetical protein